MTSEGKVQPWKHGATIARALKNVKMDGLTGSIRYISNIQLPNCNRFSKILYNEIRNIDNLSFLTKMFIIVSTTMGNEQIIALMSLS